MFILNNEKNINELACSITSNSELFSDEVQSVISHLVDLWEDTLKYGCNFTRNIPTMWGSFVTVKSICPQPRNSWTF